MLIGKTNADSATLISHVWSVLFCLASPRYCASPCAGTGTVPWSGYMPDGTGECCIAVRTDWAGLASLPIPLPRDFTIPFNIIQSRASERCSFYEDPDPA